MIALHSYISASRVYARRQAPHRAREAFEQARRKILEEVLEFCVMIQAQSLLVNQARITSCGRQSRRGDTRERNTCLSWIPSIRKRTEAMSIAPADLFAARVCNGVQAPYITSIHETEI